MRNPMQKAQMLIRRLTLAEENLDIIDSQMAILEPQREREEQRVNDILDEMDALVGKYFLTEAQASDNVRGRDFLTNLTKEMLS
jgi:hypothetical protein